MSDEPNTVSPQVDTQPEPTLPPAPGEFTVTAQIDATAVLGPLPLFQSVTD